MQETQVRSLCWEDLLEEKMATHSNILAWKNSTDRGFSQAIVLRITRVGHNLATKPPLLNVFPVPIGLGARNTVAHHWGKKFPGGNCKAF